MRTDRQTCKSVGKWIGKPAANTRPFFDENRATKRADRSQQLQMENQSWSIVKSLHHVTRVLLNLRSIRVLSKTWDFFDSSNSSRTCRTCLFVLNLNHDFSPPHATTGFFVICFYNPLEADGGHDLIWGVLDDAGLDQLYDHGDVPGQ